MFLLSFAISKPLSKLRDNLGKSAKGMLTTNLVAFRAAVLAVYGAIVSWGIIAMPGGAIVGGVVAITTGAFVLLLVVASRLQLKSPI